jgi:corin
VEECTNHQLLSLIAGICLPVITNFCRDHRVPYTFTMFPNYMGNFNQRDAQQVSTATMMSRK